MNSLIRYFVKYPIAGNLLLVMALIFGTFSFLQLKTTFFPQVPPQRIFIETTYLGASPEEVEKGVILKIEENLKSVTGIERVISTSKENVGVITVEILKGYDAETVYKDVKNAVDRIPSFPDNSEPPIMYIDENLSPQSVRVAIYGEVDLKELKKKAEIFEDQLLSTGFISKVTISGYPELEIEVSVDEDRLKAYDLTFEGISQAIAQANLEITGGTLEGEKQEIAIRANTKEYYADELGDLIVKSMPNGALIKLREVANVKDRWADVPARNYLNGKPAVIVNIQNTGKEDLIQISEYVRKYCKEFVQLHPNVIAEVVRDGSYIVQQRKEMLMKNGLFGLALVLVFLAMFLNIRLAFWVAVGIPFAFFGLFIIGAQTGLTLNVISLFGMILVIGILVDDGIIIAESIYQQYEKGLPPLQAAMVGTTQVLPAIISAILTTVIAFSIFFFLDGGIGDFISDMAFVVIVTLLVSLIEAILILPGHVGHSKAISGKSKEFIVERYAKKIITFLRERSYRPVLKFCLNNKAVTAAVPISLMIITMGAIAGGIVSTTFFPNIDFDDFNVVLEMPAGTSEEVTNEWISKIEKVTMEVNEHFSSQRDDSLQVIQFLERINGPGSHQAQLSATLLDGERRNLPTYKISNMIRERMGPISNAESVTYGRISPFGKPVDISLQSHDLDQLKSAAHELKEKLSNLNDLKDVVNSDREGAKEVHLELKDKARLLGLTEASIMMQVRQGFFGSEVQRLQRGADEVKVWVRYDESERKTITDLEEMYIRTAQGQYPLKELVNFAEKPGVLEVKHLYGKREVRLGADMGNPDASSSDMNFFVTDSIMPYLVAKYPSLSYTMEGQVREQQKMFKSMGVVGPIILFLMLFLIVFTFRSVLQMVIVWITIPFGIIGVVWGHFVWGYPVSILSMYGIIALVGIMVNDSLVLIAAVNQNLKDGMKYHDALFEGALSRFRPILLTSVTTVLGLLPLMLEKSLQAEFLKPMAISVAYGLLFATVLTLLVVPVMLMSANNVRVFWRWYWYDEKVAREIVEPAVRELKYDEEL